MKTLTITREMVESLDSDESKLDFIDSAIALLTDRDAQSGEICQGLQKSINVDLPEPLEGAPGFDSSNMSATQIKIFSMVRAGYFPVHLNCGYADYKYKHRDEFSADELIDIYCDVSLKKNRSNGKRDFQVFLDYIRHVINWYLMKRKVDGQR